MKKTNNTEEKNINTLKPMDSKKLIDDIQRNEALSRLVINLQTIRSNELKGICKIHCIESCKERQINNSSNLSDKINEIIDFLTNSK